MVYLVCVLYFKISYENAALGVKFVGLRKGRGIWGTFVQLKL